MRAKFERGPTVVSKKGSLKFISRFFEIPAANHLNMCHEHHEVVIDTMYVFLTDLYLHVFIHDNNISNSLIFLF